MVGILTDGMIGDLSANVEKLKGHLRQARFPVHRLDIEGLRAGRPAAVLPILHYIFLGFSVLFSRFLSEKGHELHAKSDLRFLEAAYKALRENLGYSPALSTAQFFSNGFAERKVLLCQDVLQLARRKHGELMSSSAAPPHRRPERRAGAGAAAADLLGAIPARDPESHLEVLRDSIDVCARPQTPPKPCPMDSSVPAELVQGVVLEADSAMSCQESQTIIADTRWHSPPKSSKPVSTAEFEALHELLESIRTALNRRFDALERRFEAYVEEADARAAVLQGEVKILTSRLQEATRSKEAVRDQVPSTVLRPVATCMVDAKPSVPSLELPTAPTHHFSLQGEALSSYPSLEVPANGAGGPQTRLEKLLPSAHVENGGLAGAANATASSGDSWTRLQEHAKSEFVDRDTHVLIEQLSCKFRDTQELINKAQEKMHQVGISTQGVKNGLGPCFAAAQHAQADSYGDMKSISMLDNQSRVHMNSASRQSQKENVELRWQAAVAPPRGGAEALLG